MCRWWWARKYLHRSSYLVVTNLASTKIGNCHVWFFFALHLPPFYISADIRCPSATGPKHRRDRKWRGAGVISGWGGGERGWFPIRRGQPYWERGAPVTQAGPRHVLNLEKLAGLQRVQTEIHCTSLHLLSMWIHHSSQLKHSFIIEAWRQDGQLSRIWSGLWLYSNFSCHYKRMSSK